MLDHAKSRTTGRPSRVAILALLLASPFAAACGGSMGDDTAGEGAVGASRDAYVGGTTASMAEWGALVKVNYSNGFCAGSLLSDTWVLTARHCVPGANSANPPSQPGGMSVRNLNGVSRGVAEAFYMNLETDVALLRLSTPLPLDFGSFGQNLSPIHYLYPYPTEGLVRRGEQVRCAGFGKRTSGGSAGTGNWAYMNAEDQEDDGIQLISNNGVTPADGDSGGPCVKQIGQTRFQFYVHTGSWTPGTAIGTGSGRFRDWALGIMKVGVGLYSESNYKGDAQTIANSSLTLARVGMNAISSIRVPPGWQVTLWDTILPGSGNSRTFTADAPVMPTGWDNRAQSVSVTQNGVQVYRDNSFLGTTLTLGPGRHDAAALGALNNNISSLRIPSDWRVKAFPEPGFVGHPITFYGSAVGSLGAENDKISSIIVEQAPTVYNDILYYGHYQILWEGAFDYDDIGFPDDAATVQSLIVPDGWDFWVTGYEQPYSTGVSETFVSSQPWMPIGWDQRIQSVEVTR